MSFNRYYYCKNNPEKYIDLDGKLAILAAMAIGFVVGAVVDLGIQAYDNYSSGKDVLDVNNYNFVETGIVAVGSALTIAVPYAAPAIASGLGISIKAVSLVGYGVIGGTINAAVEKAANPETTGSSIAIKTLEGVGGVFCRSMGRNYKRKGKTIYLK